MSKHPIHSKMIVANAIALAVACYQYFVGPLVPVDPQLWALTVALVNIGLRFKTRVPVTL